ncbi:substrate-binding domain-containing protein [Streptomyces sp. URMC 129]|uniref:substrate-binding domain-containing protein n=1 Tax=Streptomyces sp. URMC 129 TaxID=3423407 RepID=UPI003F1B4316
MATLTCGAAVLATAVLLTSCLAACGDRADGGEAGDGPRIGVLLPDNLIPRWENRDKPLIERSVRELCPACPVRTVNAQNSVAIQQQQVDSMITEGVDVLILDALDARAMRSAIERADEAGIPVVAYDRLAEGPISGFVSFDNEQVGRLQGEALLRAMGDAAGGGEIAMMNGASTDPNSAEYKRGALSVLEGRVEIGAAYDTADWAPRNAFTNASGAIAALGPGRIDGFYSANDGLASGVIAALKAANVDPLPPVTGQDADLSALQRIIEGEQYMTVYKPFHLQAEAAAEMAVALGRGEPLGRMAEDTVANGTRDAVPAIRLRPVPVTADDIADDIRDTVVKDGVFTVDQICTPRYETACERAGLL